jgi:hypothetical protein
MTSSRGFGRKLRRLFKNVPKCYVAIVSAGLGIAAARTDAAQGTVAVF